ncbi:MAG TPA: LacI family transcriptional regulator [Microbacteriaceae bacterium]|jgi:LacI family transcriptional regulator|nr:LacI family transcriptional regulator [Microbacteriaceae bacterium]
MVTMSDVARVADVSASTVSHVINKTRKVLPDTEKAVLAAIEATGYWGDGIARSLRKGTTETIGLAMSAISNPYFGDVVHAIEQSVSKAGYSLLLADTHDDPAREKRAVKDLLSHRVDAMIVAPSSDPEAILDTLSKRSIPTVLIDRVPDEIRTGMDAIGVINDEPTAKLVDHLAQLGHTRIATITSRTGLTTTTERLHGYWTGIDRNGLARDPDLVRVGDDGTGEAVELAVAELLALSAPPTAIVMGNNQVTIATMAALRNRRMSVPADIALVAFDDFPWADLFHPRLTTMSQPVEELGAQAVKMLLERLDNRDLPSRHIRLEPTFMHRESCGCNEG